jgi:hypothetical protein
MPTTANATRRSLGIRAPDQGTTWGTSLAAGGVKDFHSLVEMRSPWAESDAAETRLLWPQQSSCPSEWLATLSATVWFDFFLTRPYLRLAITHRPDIETAVSLFVVGLVVTELAARNRHHYEWASEESDYVGLIHSLSELSASGAPREAVIQRARTELMDLLHLRACRFESELVERRTNRIKHDGHVMLGGNVWNVDRMGLPGPELELLVQARGRTQGRFVLTPTPGFPVSLERRVVAVAIADQVGAAHRSYLRSA